MKTALKGKDPTDPIKVVEVREGITETAMSIIVPALGDDPFRIVQERENADNVSEKLNERYAGKTANNKLTVLQTVLNKNDMKNRSMGDHMSILESLYARLAAMQTCWDDSTKVSVLITTLEDIPDFEPFMTSISVIAAEKATWVRS